MKADLKEIGASLIFGPPSCFFRGYLIENIDINRSGQFIMDVVSLFGHYSLKCSLFLRGVGEFQRMADVVAWRRFCNRINN